MPRTAHVLGNTEKPMPSFDIVSQVDMQEVRNAVEPIDA